MPTFWGSSSIYHTGLELIKNFSEDYTLVFRPHPQTPKKLLRKYLKLIRQKDNVFYLSAQQQTPTLTELIKASTVIISDVSSVIVDAVVAEKPLIVIEGLEGQGHSDLSVIKRDNPLYTTIDDSKINNINDVIRHSLQSQKQKKHASVANRILFDTDGNSVNHLVKFIEKQAKKGRP